MNIIPSSKNPYNAWRMVFNSLYIEDLLKYLRSISNTIVYGGSIGSYLPSYFIILERILIKEFANKLLKNKLKTSKIYYTPLDKSDSLSKDILIKCILLEINRLNPIYVYSNIELNISFKYKYINNINDIIKELINNEKD